MDNEDKFFKSWIIFILIGLLLTAFGLFAFKTQSDRAKMTVFADVLRLAADLDNLKGTLFLDQGLNGVKIKGVLAGLTSGEVFVVKVIERDTSDLINVNGRVLVSL